MQTPTWYSPTGSPLVHRVEGRDAGDVGRGQAEDVGADLDPGRGDPTLDALHQVQHRQQRRPGLRIAGRDLRSSPASLGDRRSVARIEARLVEVVGRARDGPTGTARAPGSKCALPIAAVAGSLDRLLMRSTPPITGSRLSDGDDDVGDHRALAHRPASACRLTKLGSRKWARNGRVPPSETTCAPSSPRGRLDRHVGLARRHPEALGDQLEVVDQRLHRLAHDVLDVLVGVAHAVAADGQLRRPGDLRVGDHHRVAAASSPAARRTARRSSGSPTSRSAGSGTGRTRRRCPRSATSKS